MIVFAVQTETKNVGSVVGLSTRVIYFNDFTQGKTFIGQFERKID